jgi:M6 family metalloprotease-like protein
MQPIKRSKSMAKICRRQDALWQKVKDRFEDSLAFTNSVELTEGTADNIVTGVNGDIVGLCIPVKFSNVPEMTSVDQIRRFLNSPHESVCGNNGSVHRYFLDNSLGKCRYTNVVAEWYTAQNPFEYYDDPYVSFGIRAQELVQEALEWLRMSSFDFSNLTYTDCQIARSITILYAGSSRNVATKGLWSHQDELANCVRLGPAGLARKYAVIGAGDADCEQGRLQLGPFCHEVGHLLCSFPDLYDLDAEIIVQSHGVGDYCLMGHGGSRGSVLARNPVNLSAYMKLFAGWAIEMKDLATAPGPHMASADRNEFFYYSKSDSEYFLIENRQKSGRDAELPSSGLAIWHIDHNGSNRYEQRADYHYECSLEQADGRFDLEQTDGAGNSGDSEDLFPTAKWSSFGYRTTPNSRWWDGSPSGLEITNVARHGSDVMFEVQPSS